MQTTATLLHLTLNTGHMVHTSGITPPEELAAVQSLLAHGGPTPTRDPYWVELNRQPGWASFCVYRGEVPLSLNVLAWEDVAAPEAWAGLEFIYLNLSDQFSEAMAARACPARPTTTPWLATMLFPSLALPGRSVSELIWITAFERIYAETLLAEVAA
ncbi:MAG: hypothetical protein FD161_1817 [Limisphaerales bacterium]|nr:MAG: hypothetical protein FD161_1817 [Limisphaerales bacterium]TXT47787.1 MAG: hypothetical protein FD140_4060 [Limisphaerales bacterium]